MEYFIGDIKKSQLPHLHKSHFPWEHSSGQWWLLSPSTWTVINKTLWNRHNMKVGWAHLGPQGPSNIAFRACLTSNFNTYQICRASVLFLLTLTFSITGPLSLSLSLTMFYNFQLLHVRLTKPDEEQSCSKLLLLITSNNQHKWRPSAVLSRIFTFYWHLELDCLLTFWLG